MPQYIEVNGEVIEFPDNMSDAQIAAALKGQATPPAATIPGQAAKAPATQEAPSTLEQMFGAGSPIARTLKGAIVDPALAVNQLLANTGLFGQDIKAGANRLVQQSEKMTEEGRARVGSTGFDPYQLLGGVVSPVNKLIGVAQAPATAGGMGSKVLSSVSTGAGLAAFQPVTGQDKDFVESKLFQMGVGGVLGPLTEGGIKAVGALANLFKGLTPSGREAAMKQYVDNLAGEDKTKVITALQDAKELVTGSRPTVSEALSDIPSAAELLAAQKKLSGQAGQVGKFAERSAEQQAARVRALQQVSGTEAQRAAVATKRSAVTGEMRETALDQANIAGPISTKLEKEISDGFNSLAAAEQTTGMVGSAARKQMETALAGKPGWLTAGDISADAAQRAEAYARKAQTLRKDVQLKQYQLDSLEQNGFFPLRASDIVDSINSAIKGTVSDDSKKVLEGVKEKILSKADENGILNSRDLYENVRKTLNQDIATYLGQAERYAQGGIPEQAAKTAGNVKQFIDAALNKSSEGLWKKYLDSYTAYSSKLNRMEIGDYLSKKLQTPLDKERAGVFATAVENAAGTIKKATGIPRYEKLSDVLTTRETAVVNSVLEDLKRGSKADELASKVSKLPEGQTDVAKELPAILSRTVSILRTGIEYIQRGNTKEFNNKMTELMLDPKGLAVYMSTDIKKGKVNDFVSSLMKLMDDSTRNAFIQSFTVPQTSSAVGQ